MINFGGTVAKNIPELTMPEYGFFLLDAVERVKKAVRHFYYLVMLIQFDCPKCNGDLTMIGNSLSRCSKCGIQIDPTVEFQKCNQCGEKLIKRTFHYHCVACRSVAQSRFLFDERVFDKNYFCQMMRESRERKKQKHSEIQALLKESRSDPIIHEYYPNLDEITGLTEAIDAMVCSPIPKELLISVPRDQRFDLEQYKTHILSVLYETCEVLFDDICPLIDNSRKDRIFRFITLVFMNHWGDIELSQYGEKLLVEKVETHS